MSDEDHISFKDLPDEIKKILSSSEHTRLIATEVGTRTKEKADLFVSASRALLIAHGAGIITGLQVLTQNQNKNITNINEFCAVFCFGFIISMIANFFAHYALDDASARYWEIEETNDFKTHLWLTAGSIALSFAILFLAVVKIGHNLFTL